MREIRNHAIPLNGLSLDQGLARFSDIPVALDLSASMDPGLDASGFGTTKTGNAESFDVIGKSALAF